MSTGEPGTGSMLDRPIINALNTWPLGSHVTTRFGQSGEVYAIGWSDGELRVWIEGHGSAAVLDVLVPEAGR